MANIPPIDKFKFFANMALPLVYDETLSYYETLNKVVYKLNEIINLANTQTQAIEDFETQITEFVTTWESNLMQEIEEWKTDTEEDIDGWLNNALESITAWEEQFENEYATLKTEVEQIAEDADAAKTAAEDSATAAAESAANAAESAESVATQVTQIETNTIDITKLKESTNAVIDTIEHTSPNLMNFDDADFKTGYYININTGNTAANPNYNTSGFIPVESGEQYTLTYGLPIGTSRVINYICGYDNEKRFISTASASSARGYTVPENVAFVRFSSVSTYFNKQNGTVMFYKGTTIDRYYPYFEPYNEHKIKNDALDTDYITIIAKNTVNAKISTLKNDYNVTVKAEADNMVASDTLIIASNLDNAKNVIYEFIGYFDSFNSVTLGHGYNVGYGSYAVINNTDIIIYYGNGLEQARVSHELTISNFLHILIKQDQTPYASVEIITGTGSYKLTSALWRGCKGSIFAKVGGNVTNIIASATFKDFNQNVFLFGDSYVTIGDTARYPYYLNQNGFTHIMIDGWGGRKAEEGITSFTNTMTIAKPKYAIWTLGMNNADSASGINTNWKTATDTFIAMCEENGVVPILATIPNVPSVNNSYKNAYIKASGKRYIDFAKAVENPNYNPSTDEPINMWLPGMLNPGTESAPDMVHPTTLGAKALYARFIIDVPEVMQ